MAVFGSGDSALAVNSLKRILSALTHFQEIQSDFMMETAKRLRENRDVNKVEKHYISKNPQNMTEYILRFVR